MDIGDWLQAACEDADRRGLPALKPLLESLARATEELRRAPWNDDASGPASPKPPTFTGGERGVETTTDATVPRERDAK